MDAIQFIKEHGVEKAREVVSGAPHWPVIGWDAVGNNYIFKQCEHAPCSYSNLDNAWSEEYALELILLDDLKRLVEIVDHSVDVNDMGDDTHIENHISKNCKVIDYE